MTGLSTAPITLPPLYCPFPLAIHPKAAEVEVGTVAWLDRFQLYRDETQRRRLIQARCGTLAAYQNPSGAQELLQALTDFLTWAFAFDDEYCDEGPTHDKPVELAEAISRMQRAIEIPEYPVDPADRYAMALRDIRMRLDAHAGPPRGEDFVHWMRGYFQTEVCKSGNVSRGLRPNLNDYAVVRLYSGGGMVFPRLGPIVAGIPMPPATLADRRVHALLEMAATVCNWDTDIFSHPKELERTGDGYNLIEVVGAEYGLPVDEALSTAIAMRDRILCLYIRLRESVTAAAPELNGYLTTFESYIRGTIQWNEETDRYSYLDGLSGPRTTQPGGVTDTPSDDTPAPLPLPSIMWWWRYDPAGRRPTSVAQLSRPRMVPAGVLAARPRVVPADVLAARTRELRAYLAAQVDESGAIREHCGSRILETTLMVVLLRRENLYPEVQQGLMRFLRARRDSQDLIPLERALANACLGDRPGDQDVTALLDGFDHFTAGRKRLMFGTYLALLGLIPYDTSVDPSTVRYDGFASWVGLTMCAVKILNAYGQGRPQAATDQDRSFLIKQLTTGSDREVWEGHVAAHLMALIAVHDYLPGSSLIRTGVDRILAHRNQDGGLPFIVSMTVFLTSLAGSALAASGADPALLRRMADYLANRQAPDGGWSYTVGVRQTDVDDTSCCVEFLNAVDPGLYHDVLGRARGFLTAIANNDGGFPTYLRGHTSEVTMTANGVIASPRTGTPARRLCNARSTSS